METGKIFGFLGPNGAGKTTTIKMLTTTLVPTSGAMTLDGQDLIRNPLKARRSFGIVFQDPSLDDELTAYEHGTPRRAATAFPRANGNNALSDF